MYISKNVLVKTTKNHEEQIMFNRSKNTGYILAPIYNRYNKL